MKNTEPSLEINERGGLIHLLFGNGMPLLLDLRRFNFLPLPSDWLLSSFSFSVAYLTIPQSSVLGQLTSLYSPF